MSENNHTTIPQAFLLALQVEIENQPQGVGEYDLMMLLKSQGYFDFLSKPALPHELFRAHFFLFHSLYLLSNILIEQKVGLLEIHTLRIQLHPYQKCENVLQVDSKLKAYYLDFNNLENTTEDDVSEMLASFWNNYNKFENRDEALAELGLQDPVTDKMIKQEYRRLIMQHHPDRGGETEKLQKLNDVIKTLLG